MKKQTKSILFGFLLFLTSCSASEILSTFKAKKEVNLREELNPSTLAALQWTEPKSPITYAMSPVTGSLTMALNSPLYTLRTEGVGTSFQPTEAYENLLYQSLLDYKLTRNTYSPVLAKRWSFQPRTEEPLYFELEESACWSDGSPVTAEDVVATFEFLKEEDLEHPEKTNFFKKVKASALSDHLVRVSMPEMDEGSFYRLVKQSIYPAKELALFDAKSYLKNFNDKVLMGSGPYTLDEKHSLKEKEITFHHKENYWGRKLVNQRHLYNFQTIKYQIIQDAKTREWSFKEGLLDVLVVSSAKSWVQDWVLEKEPLLARGIWQKRKVINAIPLWVSGIAFNLQRSFISDLPIRQALAYLFNRQEIMDSLFLGEYLPTNSFYPGSQFENPKNFTYQYNPNKARQLLTSMGYQQTNAETLFRDSNGKSIDIELLITKREVPFFQQFSDNVKKIGINLKVTVLPYNALQMRLINHDFDMAYTGFVGSLFPRPDLQFTSSLANEKNSLNIWGIKDNPIDQLLENFVQKTPEEQLKAIQQVDYDLSKKIIFLYCWHAPYANRLVYWNKFNQPIGLLGEYEKYYAITKYWSINPKLQYTIKRHSDPSIFFPVGNEVFNYYQSQL